MQDKALTSLRRAVYAEFGRRWPGCDFSYSGEIRRRGDRVRVYISGEVDRLIDQSILIRREVFEGRGDGSALCRRVCEEIEKRVPYGDKVTWFAVQLLYDRDGNVLVVYGMDTQSEIIGF